MTYRELLIELAKLNQEQLDSNVYVKNTATPCTSTLISFTAKKASGLKLDTDDLPIITY